FEEMTYMNLQFAGLFGFGNLGLNVSTFSYGDIDNYIDGTLTGTVAPSDMMLSLSYGLMVAKDLHAGLTIKYVSEKLTDEYSGTAFAGDIGLIYGIPLGALFKKDLTQPLYIGIVAQNVGMGPQFDQEKNDLPMNIRAGLAYKIRFPSALAKLKDINLTLDLLVPTDADVGVRYGTEMWWYNLPGGLDASLRFGLKMPQDLGAASGITAGAGLRIFQVEVDYALVNFGDLGTTHRIGLTYKFGKIEKPVDEAPSAEEEEEFDFEDKPSGKNKKDDAKKAIKDKKEVKDEEDDFEFEE
ncbi:MAG: PorV/PorQ family protein, partial [Spirochaetes bacterium]|nr:PorV/PorQ family protein [Spirochaetota bacterium]